MSFYLGKFLELNGMLILGLGLAFGVFGEDVKMEMGMLALGAAVFLVGYLLEVRRRGRD